MVPMAACRFRSPNLDRNTVLCWMHRTSVQLPLPYRCTDAPTHYSPPHGPTVTRYNVRTSRSGRDELRGVRQRMSAQGMNGRSQSLYRKYRPTTFAEDDLVGQEHVSRTLRNAV